MPGFWVVALPEASCDAGCARLRLGATHLACDEVAHHRRNSDVSSPSRMCVVLLVRRPQSLLLCLTHLSPV